MRISDWSSDVCSSDLFPKMTHGGVRVLLNGRTYARPRLNSAVTTSPMCREIWGITTPGKLKSWQHRQHWLRLTGYMASARSEERRVGKAGVSTCRSGWWPCHKTKKRTIIRKKK